MRIFPIYFEPGHGRIQMRTPISISVPPITIDLGKSVLKILFGLKTSIAASGASKYI